MQPRGRALLHEAGPLLRQYATTRYPAECGREWTLEELDAAVKKEPHKLALHPEAATQFFQEAAKKEQQGFCQIVR